jgi:hypothetical protein
MRTGIACGTVVLVLALVRGGEGEGSPHEVLVKDMIAALEQASKVLMGIVDEGSVEAARPELKKTALRLRELRKKARQLKQPSKAEKDRLETEYRDKMDEALKKLRNESIRVKAIPGGPEAVKELAVQTEKKAGDKGKKGKS